MIIRLVVFVWLVVAFAVGATGTLRHLPVPPPALAMGLTVAALLVVRLSRGARDAVFRLGPGPLVLFHLVRIAAGGYFLVLGSRGVLPREFTTPAGWGDILVGIAALWVLLRCLPVRSSWQRVAFLVWNVVGLLDILGVVGNAVRLYARDRSFVEPFMSLPLAILPLFVVPIVIVSHVLLFRWVRLKADTTSTRAIVGFHQDDEGHWVAELECGHSQHMRHDPPWQNRDWVMTPEGRARFVGVRVECRQCSQA